MFSRVLHAPMRFFDLTPSGVVMNRFSSDLAEADEVIPQVTSYIFDVRSTQFDSPSGEYLKKYLFLT